MIFLGSNHFNALVPHSRDSQLSVWQGSNHLQDRSGQCETGIFRYGDTVDGWDIRRSPVDMVNIPLFSWVLYIQTVVFSPDFERTINSINRRIAILLVTSFGGTEDAEVTPFQWLSKWPTQRLGIKSGHGHSITWREKQKVEGIFGWIYPKTLNVWCIFTYIYHLNYLNLNNLE